jgi:hypothetical protein
MMSDDIAEEVEAAARWEERAMSWTIEDVRENARFWELPVEPMEAFYRFCMGDDRYRSIYGAEPVENTTAEGDNYWEAPWWDDFSDRYRLFVEAKAIFDASREGERQTLVLPGIEP